MTDISDARNIIQEEETRYRAPTSESMFTRMGAANNFIMNRQYDTHSFFINGNYTKASGQTGLEGLYVLQFDIEIVGVSLGNLVPGASGTTTFDIHLIDGGGTDQGSIFSLKPSITSTAGSNAYAAENYPQSVSQTASGVTLPTLSGVNYDQFDAFRFDVDSAMLNAENCFFNIHFRPR